MDLKADPTGKYGGLLTLSDTDLNNDELSGLYQLHAKGEWRTLVSPAPVSERQFQGIAFSNAGPLGSALYVADAAADNIWIASPKGHIEAFAIGFTNPQRIAIGPEGADMWVADQTGLYRIFSTDPSDWEAAKATLPVASSLESNYPNPFNSSTQIPYRVSVPGPVRLVIYNVLGQPVRTLVDEIQAAGAYQFLGTAATIAAHASPMGFTCTGFKLGRSPGCARCWSWNKVAQTAAAVFHLLFPIRPPDSSTATRSSALLRTVTEVPARVLADHIWIVERLVRFYQHPVSTHDLVRRSGLYPARILLAILRTFPPSRLDGFRKIKALKERGLELLQFGGRLPCGAACQIALLVRIVYQVEGQVLVGVEGNVLVALRADHAVSFAQVLDDDAGTCCQSRADIAPHRRRQVYAIQIVEQGRVGQATERGEDIG